MGGIDQRPSRRTDGGRAGSRSTGAPRVVRPVRGPCDHADKGRARGLERADRSRRRRARPRLAAAAWDPGDRQLDRADDGTDRAGPAGSAPGRRPCLHQACRAAANGESTCAGHRTGSRRVLQSATTRGRAWQGSMRYTRTLLASPPASPPDPIQSWSASSWMYWAITPLATRSSRASLVSCAGSGALRSFIRSLSPLSVVRWLSYDIKAPMIVVQTERGA